MLNVLISGTSNGIGRAVAEIFLERGASVTGLDICEATIDHPNYAHYVADVSRRESLPQMDRLFNIVVSNAGIQTADCNLDDRDVDVNLKGSIYFVEKYAFQPEIKSVLLVASASAHSGAEFPMYSASKGGLLSYMKNAALRLAKFGATCNSISPGGVTTDLNRPVMDDPKLWKSIMDVTPLKRWASPQDIAEWVYFLTVVNRNCTGQDILIDNGEKDLNSTFVWPESL